MQWRDGERISIKHQMIKLVMVFPVQVPLARKHSFHRLFFRKEQERDRVAGLMIMEFVLCGWEKKQKWSLNGVQKKQRLT